jgi:hypothetical protein
LERSQSTDHEDANGQSIPQTAESDFAVNPADGLASTLTSLAVIVQFRDHDICAPLAFLPHHLNCFLHTCRMRNNRTSNTSDVTSQETHTSLLQTAELILWFAQELVDLRNRLLKRRKLDHRIRDLACPERVQTLVQSTNALLPDDLCPSLPQRMRERRQRCLHSDLDSLHGTQGEISEELGGRGGSEEDDLFRGAGREPLAVEVLEDFVEAVFACALHAVADEGGCPAEEYPAQTFFGVDHLPGLRVGLVEGGVDLAAAFHLNYGVLAV